MSEDRLHVLIDRLIATTTTNKVKWVEKRSGVAFELTTDSGRRVMIDSRDDDGDPPYDLYIFDGNGKSLTTVLWSTDVTQASVPLDHKLHRLYKLAEDAALGISSEIDDLLNELPEADDIPF